MREIFTNYTDSKKLIFFGILPMSSVNDIICGALQTDNIQWIITSISSYTYRIKEQLRNPKSELDVYTSILVLRAAQEGASIPEQIGTKVGSSVLVSQDLINRFSVIDHDMNLFGQCHCSTDCYSGIFLGAPLCRRKMILSIMMLNRVLLPELSRVICEILLKF